MALTDKKRQEVLAALSDLDVDELREVSEHVRQLRAAKVAAKRLWFRIGQRVEFSTLSRGLIQGVVTGLVTGLEEFNVLVDAGEKGQWRVSAAVLQPVEGS